MLYFYHMAIKDELLAIANANPEIKSKFYGTDFEANAAEAAAFPMLHIQTITSSALAVSGVQMTMTEKRPVYLFFADKSDLDMTTEQQEEIITRMKLLAAKFLFELNKSGKFEIVREMPLKNHYYKFDYVVSGVVAFVNLTDKQPILFC